MSVGNLGKTTNEQRELTGSQIASEREAMFGEIPGEIIDFNPDTQTATIRPLYRPKHNGESVDMPELLEVPLRFQRMGGFVVTTPVKAGDKVSLRPQMRSSEEYHTEGSYDAAGETRSMSLSDMEAFLDGGESLSDPITNFNNDNLEIRSADGSFKIEMSADGKFKIDGAQGNVYSLLAEAIELLASDGLDVKSGSSRGSNHALQHKSRYQEIASKLRGMAL